MRRILCVLLLGVGCIFPQAAFAGTPDSPFASRIVAPSPISKTSDVQLKNDKPALAELTNLRWAVNNDPATGAAKLRLVLDVSGPVEVDSTISANPLPQLIINVKGAARGSVPDSINFDGSFVNQVNVVGQGNETSTLLIDLPTLLDDSDYRVFTLRSDPKTNRPFRVVVDINKPVPPIVYNFTPGLKNKTIVLDPGHGGSDPGAIGLNRTYEKTITLAVALKVKNLLEKAGSRVVMTRQDDCDVAGWGASDVDELRARTTIGNTSKADVFVSIHANSFTNRTVGGTSVYYFQKSIYDPMLAQNLDRALGQSNNLKDRGVFRGNLYVTKRALMPAALVELAFLSNPNEEKMLASADGQQQLAQSIVQGLDCFFAQAAQQGGG